MADLDELVTQIQTEAGRLAKLKGSLKKPKLHKPPSASALQRGIKEMKVPPPPSYEEFLRNHNGWENFWNGWSMVGLAGKHTKAAHGDIKVAVEEDVWAMSRAYKPGTPEHLSKEEENNTKIIYLPNHIIFATDFNGQLALFDRRTRGRKGEMQVLIWSPDGVNDRYSNFTTFLNAALADIKSQIKEFESGKSEIPEGKAGDADRTALYNALISVLEEEK